MAMTTDPEHPRWPDWPTIHPNPGIENHGLHGLTRIFRERIAVSAAFTVGDWFGQRSFQIFASAPSV